MGNLNNFGRPRIPPIPVFVLQEDGFGTENS